MSTLTRSIRYCALAVAGFALCALPLNCPPVLAASKTAKKEASPQQGAPPQDEPATKGDAAKRAYEGGVKAFNSGKYQNAVDQLNVAMRAGGLGATEMAKGLYYRGLAYKKLNKPGLAISDLTSALWLKNGLSDAERKSATAERAEAYKAAGIAESENVERSAPADTPAPAAQTPVKSAAATQSAPVAQAAAAATTPVASGNAIAPATPRSADAAAESVPQPLTLGAETAAPPAPKYARTDDKVTSGAVYQAAGIDQTYAVGSAGPAATPSAVPAQPPSPATSSVASSSGGGVTGFFSKVFGGASSPTQAPAAMQTASTGPAAPAPVTPQTSSWDSKSLTGGKTAAGKSAAPSPGKIAAAAPAAAPVAAAKVKGGKYKIHIAAVRSRADADALAQRLNAEHGAAFNNRTASVDEAVIGSMGTFYRVRVGSYPTPEEPRGLCNSLRNSGYDCLVVSN